MSSFSYPMPFSLKEPQKDPKLPKRVKEEYVILDDFRKVTQRGSQEEESDGEDDNAEEEAEDEDSTLSSDSDATSDSSEASDEDASAPAKQVEGLAISPPPQTPVDGELRDSPRNFMEEPGSPGSPAQSVDGLSRYKAVDMIMPDLEDTELDDEDNEGLHTARIDKGSIGFWDVVASIRSQFAKRRRNKALRFHERRYQEELREEKRKRRLERLQAKWESIRLQMKTNKIVTAKSLRMNIRKSEVFRQQKEIDDRDRQHRGLNHRLELMMEWDVQSNLRKKEIHKAKVAVTQRREREKEEAAKKAVEKAEIKVRKEEVMQTQEVLRIMRRSGDISAVNPPAKEVQEEVLEMDKRVTIRPRSGAVLVITKQPSSRKSHGDPHAHVTYFNVDLLRLRALEEIRAEELHDTGAMALAQDLKLEQCCLKLLVLDLRGCRIGRLGVEALGEAFGKAGGKLLVHTLVLRNNEIPGRSMVQFGACLQQGGLPLLEHLDLQSNLLGDVGAVNLASTVLLTHAVPHLQHLFLQKNEIGNPGALALYRALQAADRFCPSLKAVHARQNRVTKAAYTQMAFPPACLDI